MAPSTWVVVGASRGIGLELVRQLLDHGNQVIAAVRTPNTANEIWQLQAKQARPAACVIEQCDVTDEASIDVSRYSGSEPSEALYHISNTQSRHLLVR